MPKKKNDDDDKSEQRNHNSNTASLSKGRIENVVRARASFVNDSNGDR